MPGPGVSGRRHPDAARRRGRLGGMVGWPDFLRAASDPDGGVSPWAREQAPLLDAALRAADPPGGPVRGIR